MNLDNLISSFKGSLIGSTDSEAVPKATSNIIAAFNASSNISMTMDNIATAMTNYFRGSSDITVAGQAGQIEPYVHVIWPWITLPAFLLIAGTIFYYLHETKRFGARVWKTSELTLLFHGLRESNQEEPNPFHRSSEMEHVPSGTRVKMAKTSGSRWILRREKTLIKSV